MGYAVERPLEDGFTPRQKTSSWFKSWKLIISSMIILIAFICLGSFLYQTHHFNTNISVNDVKIGSLNTEQALKRLQSSVLKNEVYIGEQKIIDGIDTEMRFTEADLPNIEKLLEEQMTLFPSFKEINYTLTPINDDQYRNVILKYDLEQKLISMNQDLTAPYNAYAILEHGNITISKPFDGTQYDVSRLIAEFNSKEYTSTINLNPIYLQPYKEDSQYVKDKQKKLQELLQHTVNYKVQNQTYSLKASELIKNASVSDDMKITLDPFYIKNKISEINQSQSTLNKNFTFKTHSGADITVKGEGYGWALDIEAETALIKEAFETGNQSISASTVHGNGWSKEGYGYDAITNGGIGDTYAEVSIKDQRMWLYKEGKMIFTTHVVTGKKSAGQDTSPGVWYILYKRTPYTLTGTSAENPYSIDVNYWAPFTNSGQGFHDASWRSNWGSNAYLNAGSNGCVNVPPGVMKTVFDNLTVYQPVVIY